MNLIFCVFIYQSGQCERKSSAALATPLLTAVFLSESSHTVLVASGLQEAYQYHRSFRLPMTLIKCHKRVAAGYLYEDVYRLVACITIYCAVKRQKSRVVRL